ESTAADEEKWSRLLHKMKNYHDLEDNMIEVVEVEPEPQGESIELGIMDVELIRQAVEKGQHPCQAQVILRKDTMMKAVRVYMILKVFEDLGEIISTCPPQPELEEEQFEHYFQVVAVFDKPDFQGLQGKLMQISDVEEVVLTPWPGENTTVTEGQKKPDVAVEDRTISEEVAIECKSDLPILTPSEAVTAAAPASAEETGQVMKAADKMVRVETQKLDDLVNLVGEMVVARTRIVEIGRGFSEDLDSTIDQLKRSITNLQDTAMELRMVPIKQVFERFPRMVRDLCRSKGKQVELLISGEDTELDRSIINRLSDPLVHLLRNSFDHGIETPDERKKKGKNPEGSILLQARHKGNQVVITVE
ncbi:MAG: hypothetical protein U1E11_12580, partial [Dethiobacteria bacterium]|nr:hypothetical protein [Dethiobacteria bacterium]